MTVRPPVVPVRLVADADLLPDALRGAARDGRPFLLSLTAPLAEEIARRLDLAGGCEDAAALEARRWAEREARRLREAALSVADWSARRQRALEGEAIRVLCACALGLGLLLGGALA